MRILDVEQLNVEFNSDGEWLPTVTEVSFHLDQGEILALVGESGCGKSVSCMALTRLLPEPPARISSGVVRMTLGKKEIPNVLRLRGDLLRKVRGGGISYIFQEPGMSLNPVFRVGAQIAESVHLHRPHLHDPWKEAVRLLDQVGIPAPDSRARQYPHEMSGGMQQRVMIAMALASDPAVLVADEPTTALDVTIQAQILELLARLRAERGMAILLVTHNLGIVSELADRVAVMYAGRIVETGSVSEVLRNPRHPYTRALIRAIPVLGGESGRLDTIPGAVPMPSAYGKGCRFFGRCTMCEGRSVSDQNRCAMEVPALRSVAAGHDCACHWFESFSGGVVP